MEAPESPVCRLSLGQNVQEAMPMVTPEIAARYLSTAVQTPTVNAGVLQFLENTDTGE